MKRTLSLVLSLCMLLVAVPLGAVFVSASNNELPTTTVTAANHNRGVLVSWGAVESAEKYEVSRAVYENGEWSNWTAVKTTANKVYLDKDVVSGADYKYQVKAVNSLGQSSYSASDELKYLARVTAKASASSEGVKISWSKIQGADEYQIRRKVLSGGKWSSFKTFAVAQGTSFIDTTVKGGNSYYYIVCAKNGEIFGEYGMTASITPVNDGATCENKVLETNLKDNSDKLLVLGKTSATDTGYILNGTADALSFTAFCEGDIVLNYASSGVKSAAGHGVYFTVYVDGVRKSERLHIQSNGNGSLTVAENLSRGTHTVKLVRQTEYVYGTTITFGSVSTSGILTSAPKNKPYTIEFIGDSITCGYGSIADSVTALGVANGAPIFQDGTKTYAYLTAEALNADIVATSKTGIGILKNSEGTLTMPDFYKYYPNLAEQIEPNYNINPNLVVISLGTNDRWQGVTADEFADKLVEFAGTIRAKYPNVPMIFLGGMMIGNKEFNASYAAAADALGGEDAGFYSYVTTSYSTSHPISTEHEVYSDELVEFITSKNILK